MIIDDDDMVNYGITTADYYCNVGADGGVDYG